MLIVATLTAGLTGFVMQQQTLQTALRQSLQTEVHDRATTYRFLIRENIANIKIALFGDRLTLAAGQLLGTTGRPTAKLAEQRFLDVAHEVSGDVFSSIVVLDRASQPVSIFGEYDRNRTVVVPITAALPTTLGWSAGRYKLHTEVPVTIDGRAAGAILLEQTLVDFQRTVLGVDKDDVSREVVICASKSEQLECYPSAKTLQPFFISPNDLTGKPLPMTHGIAGETGITKSLDYRGNNVEAAYAPLGNGLGLVVKKPTTALYAGIRDALKISALLMMMIALSGAILLRFLLRPMTTRLRETELRLTQLARYDSLTGLPNRAELNERLESALARRHRSGKRLAVLFLDIDHFKLINDTMGHAIGDAVLKEFAKRLLLSVRSTDTVARLAGDEFVVVLEGLGDASEAEKIAQKINERVRAELNIETHHIALTTSIGVTCGFAKDLTSPDLLAMADTALYRAKSQGRNTFAVESC